MEVETSKQPIFLCIVEETRRANSRGLYLDTYVREWADKVWSAKLNISFPFRA